MAWLGEGLIETSDVEIKTFKGFWKHGMWFLEDGYVHIDLSVFVNGTNWFFFEILQMVRMIVYCALLDRRLCVSCCQSFQGRITWRKQRQTLWIVILLDQCSDWMRQILFVFLVGCTGRTSFWVKQTLHFCELWARQKWSQKKLHRSVTRYA